MIALGACSSRWWRRIPSDRPAQHLYRYIGQELPRPSSTTRPSGRTIPMSAIYAGVGFNTSHQGPNDLQRALAGYFGLVSFLDEQVGKILGIVRGRSRRLDPGDLHLGSRRRSRHAGIVGQGDVRGERRDPMLAAGEGVRRAVCGDTGHAVRCDRDHSRCGRGAGRDRRAGPVRRVAARPGPAGRRKTARL